MTKYTTEMAELHEITSLLDALCDGCLELNKEFLERYAGSAVREQLMRLPYADRAFHLSSVVDEDNCSFLYYAMSQEKNSIFLNVDEIEVQFDGAPEDFFENPDDWYITGDLAYHSTGYGLIVNVDVKSLKENIDEALEG